MEKKPLTVRERAAERARGAAWVRTLGRADLFRLGDELVCGDFDWRSWLNAPPSGAFLNGADDERMALEDE